MRVDQPLPNIWLLSDERNDTVLEQALAAMPARSGFVFRHYHLPDAARRARFEELGALCRRAGHLVVLSGSSDTAFAWGAAGAYGPAERLAPRDSLLRLATVHDLPEIERAERHRVDAMFLSPVFASRSHPGKGGMGRQRFLSLAEQATRPVIALGGMNAERAACLGWPRWAAIDGLS